MIIDMSGQILLESINTERTYLTYMNSTVSHEMRNPLNAICSQMLVLEELVKDMENFKLKIKEKLNEQELIEIEDLQDDIANCTNVCLSSCKLLSFNVEDIMALPQLKDGKFTMNVQNIDIRTSVKEIMSIQETSAEEQGVLMESVFHGFDKMTQKGMVRDYQIEIDEKRFQQVLLNYQSNAIKFVNKQNSKVNILVQHVKSMQSQPEFQRS